MVDVTVEVGVLPPGYMVKAKVKDAMDFLGFIQKSIDKPGKHVLCADTIDLNATNATNLNFNSTV